jgi:hypothetical protein
MMFFQGLQNLGPTGKSVDCAGTEYMTHLLTLWNEVQQHQNNLADLEPVRALQSADIYNV